jgi:hypothetical protein
VLLVCGRPNTNNTVTLIDRAYDEVRSLPQKFGALWLITDNIQETAGLQQERDDIKLFYNKLKGDDVPLVYFFPVQRAFDGFLYAEDGQTKLPRRAPSPYRDKRGVVVYAILFNKQQEENFRSAVQQAERHLGAPAIKAKPLLGETRGATSGSAIEQQWHLEKNQQLVNQGSYGFTHRGKEASGETVLHSAQVLPSNDVEGKFVVRFTSRVPHVRINDAQVKTAVVEAFALTGVTQTAPALQPEPNAISTLRPDRESGEITVHIRFPTGLSLDDPNACSWHSAQPGEYAGKIKVALEVRQERVELDDTERDQYSTMEPAFFTSIDPRHHQRIYGLNYLVSGLTPEFTQNITETSQEFYRVVFHLQCPIPTSFWGYLLGALAGLGAVVALVWLLRRSPDYRLTPEEGGVYRLWVQRAQRRRTYEDDGEYDAEPQDREYAESVHLPLVSLGRGHPIGGDGQTVADLKRSPLGTVYVQARQGFAIDGQWRQRTLTPSASGTTFAVTKNESSSSDNGSEPPPERRQRRARPSYDTDDEYDF